MDLICKIEALFSRRGTSHYVAPPGGGTCTRLPREGGEPRRERPFVDPGDQGVSALAHALQCAQLAEWAHADHSLVAAALLHDLGQLIDGAPAAPLSDDQHELRALPLLAGGFGPDVLEPIRLHVQAKRYLVATDPRYEATLSPASRLSLARQGGRMRPEEQLVFMARRHAGAALQLRRWDDLAKIPGKRTPPLAYYLALLQQEMTQQIGQQRLAIA